MNAITEPKNHKIATKIHPIISHRPFCWLLSSDQRYFSTAHIYLAIIKCPRNVSGVRALDTLSRFVNARRVRRLATLAMSASVVRALHRQRYVVVLYDAVVNHNNDVDCIG
jgi:hypothetical protein